MSLRDKLKKVKPTEPEGTTVPFDDSAPVWSTGDTLPVTWDDAEIKKLRKRTLRDNYKRGVISKEMYIKRLNYV